MEDNIYKRIEKELENLEEQSRVKLENMSQEEIEDSANKMKKGTITSMIVIGVLSAIVWIAVLCWIPSVYEGEPVDKGVFIIAAIFAIITTVGIPLIGILLAIKKDSNELVLARLKKETRKEIIAKMQQEQEVNRNISTEFSTSQVTSIGQQPTNSQARSNKEELQELKEMLDDGLITQEDFDQKKKQILGL